VKGTMRAILKTEKGPGLKMAEVDIPAVGPDDILVRVQATSICGTDYHIYSWDKWSAGRVKPPLIVGHEFAGEVVEIGERVEHVKVGDLVSAETHIVCNECVQCGMGQYHVCARTEIIGVDRDGCFAEYACIPATNAWVNDPETDPAIASAQEPLGNAVHTALAGPVAGLSFAVTGCGPIGLMSIGVLEACGARQVFATELNPYRQELARRMGAEAVFDPSKEDVIQCVVEATGGVGPDAVLEMSGNPKAIVQALRMVRPGGRVSLLGIPAKGVEIDVANDIVFKGLDVQGIAGRRIWDTWYRMKGLLTGGNLDLGALITHRLPLEDFEQGMELMASGHCGKVVLLP